MAVSIPQVVTEDRASGALVIDGSLRFDESKGQYLKFTPSSSGNRRTQTLSVWIKNTYTGGNNKMILGGGDNASGPRHNIFYSPSRRFGITQNPTGSSNDTAATVGVFRDYSGWQHLVVSLDCTVGQNSGQVRIYINGKLQENGDYNGGGSAVYITDQDGIFNTISKRMYLGHYAANPSDSAEFDGYMSQYYWIDGLALGPKYFGYTDPLTGTWRPRKFRAEGTTLNDGTNWSGNPTNFTNGDNGFNGNLGNYAEVSLSAAKGTFTFPKSIKVENNITFWFSSGTAGNLFINDEATPMGATGGFHQQDIEFTGTLSSISLQSGSQPVLYGIAVDGTILESTVTQNLDFGTNGVYLPFDGSAPIGEDKSGNGNDWTPVNFGGSNSLEKATGALPILNTTQGGTHAGVGYFGSNVSKVIAVTVSNASGSNKYYFDSVLNPTLPLIRGSIISFDTSDSSNDSHPFKLSSTNADSSGGTEYTDGVSYFVNGQQKNASDYVSQYSSHSSGFRGIKWTVPHDVSTTYYYCTSHTGMGNNGRLNSTTDVTKADPFAWKCFLALPLNDPSIDKSSTLNRTSSGKAITVSGCVSSSNRSNFYDRSTFFDGSNDQLSVEAHGQMSFGANDDWTFEVWFYTTTVSSGWAISDYSGNNSATGDPGGQIYFSASSGSGLHWYQNSAKYAEIPKEEIQANKWHHVAFVKDGTADTITSFLDGVRKTTSSFDGSSGSTANGLIIGQQGGGTFFSGYMSDFRVYKGIKKYTNNFIPASTNPDILPDTPSGIVGKSKLTKITDGAVFIIRSSDQYLQAPASTDFRLDGQYCIEYFLNLTDYSNDSVYVRTFVLDGPTGDGGSTNIHLNVNPSTGVLLFWSGSGELISGTISIAGGWHHVCLTRDSSNKTRLFIDGVLSGSADITTDYNLNSNQNRPRLGALGTTGGTTGHYSNWRIIKGSIPTEYQTSTTTNGTRAFSPPTSALTNVTNTKLLCCQSNTQPGGAAVAPSISGINNGTQWSSKVTPGSKFRSGYGPGNAFDGNSVSSISGTTACEINEVSFVEFNFGDGIPFTTLQMQCDDNNEGTVKVNGVDITSQLPTGSFTNTTITGVTSPLKTLRLDAVNANASSVYLGSITIDGVMLRDPLTRNGDVAATNFNPITDDINTIRGQETGYATWNPLSTRGVVTTSDGNLVADTVQNGNGWALSTIPMTSGKYYCEMNFEGEMYHTTNFNYIGIVPTDIAETYTGLDIFRGLGALAIESNASKVRASIGTGSGATQSDWNTSIGYDESSTIGIAIDCDTPLVKFYVDGKDVGTYPYTMAANKSWVVFCNDWASGYQDFEKYILNAGQKPFKFPPPDGFQPMNLSTVQPEKVIARPDQYFGVSLWSGNGTSQNITGLKHKPDFVWIKKRSGGSERSHQLFDSVRGVHETLHSDGDGAQDANTNRLTAFNQDGFAVGSDDGSNGSSGTFVGWTWKAGGDKNTFNIDDVGYANASDVNMNVGGLNSSVYDQSQNWTNNVSSTSNITSGHEARLFNGILSGTNADIQSSQGTSGVINFTNAITGSKIEIYTIGNVGQIGINGSNLSVTANQWVDTGVTSLTSVETRHPGAGSIQNPTGLKVDGKILVDSGLSVTNVPSSASTCRTNRTAGFSIVKYAPLGNAQTIAHNLNQKPELIIVKNLDHAYNWYVYHKDLDSTAPEDKFVILNGTHTIQDSADAWNDTPPTSSVFTVNGGNTAYQYADHIAYCFNSVKGYSKFGKYIGGGTNYPFVPLGFKPAWIMIKNVTTSGNHYDWIICDSARNPVNKGADNVDSKSFLFANTADIEDKNYTDWLQIDFLSNGFRVNEQSVSLNASSSEFVYVAFAETPFKNARAF